MKWKKKKNSPPGPRGAAQKEKEAEENEGGGAETTMETAVNAAVAAEMGKVNATMEKMHGSEGDDS